MLPLPAGEGWGGGPKVQIVTVGSISCYSHHKLYKLEVKMTHQIKRIDELPIILAMLKKLRIQEIIDKHFSLHGNWTGLSYGQLAVLFIT